MLKEVIFEMDGTLCDSFPLMIRALHEAVEPIVGHAVSDEDFMEALGPNEKGIIVNMLGDRYDSAAASYDVLYERYLPEMCAAPFDGIREIFDFLAEKNVRTALVTGKNKTSCDVTLRQFGMEAAFDAVEYGSPVGSRKKEAISLVREAGLLTASALWAPSTDAEATVAAGADVICRTPADFLRYLKEDLG